MKFRFRSSSVFLLTCLLVLPICACAKTVEIEGLNGAKIELEVHQPPEFVEGQAYSVLVGPGNYYWQDRPSQPGWVVVTSGAFWGEGRLENSKLVLKWLRESYNVKDGGFHIAGWSANSAGVFEIAMAYPEDFLSVTGIAGMPSQDSQSQLERLKGIRVQFVVGEEDRYWRSGSERWHKKLVDLGVESTLEIIPNGQHVMPEIANEPLFERLNQVAKKAASSL